MFRSRLLFLALALFVLTSAPAYAQQSSTLALSASGVLAANTQVDLPLDPAQAVNLRLAVDGSSDSSLTFSMLRADGSLAASGRASGGETLWRPLDLPQGGLLRLRNSGSSALGYRLDGYTLASLDDQPLSWAGTAAGTGDRPALRFSVAQAGIYDLNLAFGEGGGSALLDQNARLAEGAPTLASSSTVAQLPLSAGLHTITIAQDGTQSRNAWQLTLTLRRRYSPPAISALSPQKLDPNAQTTLRISGQGFDSVTRAEIIAADGSVILCPSTVVDATLILVTVPAGLARGSYSLRLSDSLGSAQSAGPALLVERNVVYLPLMFQ